MFEQPAFTIKKASAIAGVTIRAATRAIESLVADGALEEITGRKRDRIYLSRPIMDVMFARRSTVDE